MPPHRVWRVSLHHSRTARDPQSGIIMSLSRVIVIGLVFGILAKLVFLRDAPGGWLLVLMIAVAGSMAAGISP